MPTQTTSPTCLHTAEGSLPASIAKLPSSRRNITIDVLRGWCIVLMIAGHTGTDTAVNNSLHILRFVSGAEGFVFLAGVVLGMVYRRRLDAAPALESYRKIWSRAGMLWCVHFATVILGVYIGRYHLGLKDLPSIVELGVPKFLWLTATLQFQPGHALNVLPLYILLLAGTPIVLEAMRRGYTWQILAASAGLLLYTQYQPGLGAMVHESSGGDAFPIPAWQGLFVPGLAVGYHHAVLRSGFLNRWRTLLTWTLGVTVAAAALIVGLQTESFQLYDHAAYDLLLWERHPLRLGRIAYFLVSVGAFYLLAQAWQRRRDLPQFPLRMLAVLGRNSLYAFIVHIAIAFWFASLRIPQENWLMLELLPVLAIALTYLLARYQVARRFIPN
jgi:hypothetical protein